MQAQVQDCARLSIGQVIRTVLVDLVTGVIDQRDVFCNSVGRPGARLQPLPRFRGIGGRTDRLHHLINVLDRDRQTAQQVRPLPCFAQQKCRAPRHHFLAEGYERLQECLQIQLLWFAAVQRQYIAAERSLQRREAVKLVQHDVRRRIALQFDDNTHTVTVGFILYVGNTFDLLLTRNLGNALL